MVDYIRDIGGSTQLMIRDHGYAVEFFTKTGSSTYNYDQPWSFGANGGNSGTLKFRMLPGGGWSRMGSVNVGYDQSIRLTIINSGLGFPTYDFHQHIQRSTIPGAPHIFDTTPLSTTEIRVQFSAGYDGGSPVVEWQIGYGFNPWSPTHYWWSDGYSIIAPFNSGDYLYFWARGRNAIGWGHWSNRTEAGTWRIPDAPSSVGFLEVSQRSVKTQFVDRGFGGTEILERQLGYGTSPLAPTDFMAASGTGIDTVPNLSPGARYYFWVRSRNVVGWSPWSERSQIDLIAGARIFTDGQWKRAVPYVKIGGFWRVARPWVRVAGEWEETSA